jgi:hypothetical protein
MTTQHALAASAFATRPMLSITPGTRLRGGMIVPRSPALRMQSWDLSYPKSNAKEILRSRVTKPWGHCNATEGAQWSIFG